MEGSFAKASVHIDTVEDVEKKTKEAVRLALSGRRGPVHISCGIDTLKQMVRLNASSEAVLLRLKQNLKQNLKHY